MLSLAVFSLLLIASFVSAAGSSTRDDTDSSLAIINCNEKVSVRERVSCRIAARPAGQDVDLRTYEETCRNLADKEGCLRLHRSASPCYDVASIDKALCLRRNAGLGTGQLNRFDAPDRRRYAALLMYELQERVEDAEEDGRMTADQAANLIAQIVDIKEALLNNTPVADVKVMMAEFKMNYRSAMGTSS